MVHASHTPRPHITLMMEVPLLLLALHTDNTDGVSNSVDIILLPYLSLEEGFEVPMIEWWWHTVLDSNTRTSYADTLMIMTKYHIAPIVGWEGVTKTIYQSLVLINVILGPLYPAVYKISVLVKSAVELSTRLRAHAQHQLDMPAIIIRLIQTYFNERFRKVFLILLPIHCPHFTPLVQTLTTV